MRPMTLSQVSLSIFAAFIISSFMLICIGLSRSSYAEYACETYSAGTFNSGSTGTGDPCPTNTTTSTNPLISSDQGATTSYDSPVSTVPIQGNASVSLNDYVSYKNGSGLSIDMNVEQKVYFTIGYEVHTIIVKTITPEYIIFTIASVPQDVKVPYGDTIDYDVDKDGKSDISLRYTALSADGFTATAIFAATTVNSASPAIQTAADTVKTPSSNYWGILIISLIIVIVAIVIIVRRKKRTSSTSL